MERRAEEPSELCHAQRSAGSETTPQLLTHRENSVGRSFQSDAATVFETPRSRDITESTLTGTWTDREQSTMSLTEDSLMTSAPILDSTNFSNDRQIVSNSFDHSIHPEAALESQLDLCQNCVTVERALIASPSVWAGVEASLPVKEHDFTNLSLSMKKALFSGPKKIRGTKVTTKEAERNARSTSTAVAKPTASTKTERNYEKAPKEVHFKNTPILFPAESSLKKDSAIPPPAPKGRKRLEPRGQTGKMKSGNASTSANPDDDDIAPIASRTRSRTAPHPEKEAAPETTKTGKSAAQQVERPAKSTKASTRTTRADPKREKKPAASKNTKRK